MHNLSGFHNAIASLPEDEQDDESPSNIIEIENANKPLSPKENCVFLQIGGQEKVDIILRLFQEKMDS